MLGFMIMIQRDFFHFVFLAATYFFDPCEENDQCSEFLIGSQCNSGNCTCQYGFHGYENRCVRSVDLGNSCTGK